MAQSWSIFLRCGMINYRKTSRGGRFAAATRSCTEKNWKTTEPTMRQSIRERLLEGMPCLAECGGFLYVLDGLTDAEGKNSWNMVGALAGEAVPKGKLVRFRVCGSDCPGRYTISACGTVDTGAHEFRLYWDTNDNGDTFEAAKASGKGHWPCMRQEQQISGGISSIQTTGSNPELAGNFVKRLFSVAREMCRKTGRGMPSEDADGNGRMRWCNGFGRTGR